MRALTVCVLLWTLVGCQGYNAYNRGGYQTQSSSSYTSSSSSSSSSDAYGSPQLSSWAHSHLHEVREFANRLRQDYNILSQGDGYGGSASATAWSANIQELTSKSGAELDEMSRQLCQQLVTDMRQGVLSYSSIAKPNFFESRAAELLERYAEGSRQQMLDLSHFDEVKNYAYPAEVKVIDGKTYVVHRNCTEATKISPSYSHVEVLGQTQQQQRQLGGQVGQAGYYVQSPGAAATTTTITRKKTIYDWVKENMEPSVVDYRPVINVDGSAQLSKPWTSSSFRRVEKITTNHADGSSSVTGGESEKRWVNGQLVYDNAQPFGQQTVPRDEAWKREERERFFWFLNQGAITQQQLKDWQNWQEERLLGVAERYQTSIQSIEEFHRRELARYRQLLGQYQSQIRDEHPWQRQERGRLDWLIHQNSFTVEEFERWQRENSEQLKQLAQQYRITPQQMQQWQREELQRLYVHFNQVNNSIGPQPVPIVPDSGALVSNTEQERLDELIRQHNQTIATLQSSIQTDQQKLKDLSVRYQGNVHDMEKWLKEELARIAGLIKDQNDQMSRMAEWQRSERTRLETILKQHQGSVGGLELQMTQDRSYIQGLAAKYHVTIEELEKWQRTELERLQHEGQATLETNIKEWQLREREHLKSIVAKNELNSEEFQKRIMGDRVHLEELARLYKVQVTEIEDWMKSEIKKLQSEGLLKEVEHELALWQQKERERLQSIVQQNSLTVEQLEEKIKNDQTHFYELANTYQLRVEDMQDWLKKEILRMQSEGLIKAEALKDWQVAERQEIMKIVQLNKLSIEEFEQKLLADRQRLQDLSKTYNVQVSEIEHWILAEGERLRNEGKLHMEEQLNNWQKIERQRIYDLINKNNLSIEELKARIQQDQVHLYSLAQKHQVRVEEIELWIKQQIEKLQTEGVLEMEKLKSWQLEWRGNLTNMVQERDFTVEEFHKWLLEDRARLQSLAMQHNVQIEEIEQFVKREEQRFVSMGLLKPYEKLTNWQEVERMYLNQVAQQQYKSTEQLEARLRQDRELLVKLASQYSVQVEEIEQWMKQELARLRDEGQLQIDNLTTWQLAERERLEALLKQNKQWSVAEFEVALRSDREHMQTMAFQHHTSVEEIERWLQSEIARLQRQGKLDIEQLTAWQKAEQHRILSLLQQQSSITAEEFEQKVQRDRLNLANLADQYHVSVVEIETYIKQVIGDLRKKGQFEMEQLQQWQLVERDYIKQLISQYKNGLSTKEYEQKLLADRVHLNQLADQYRINVEQIETWMITELKRLRGDTKNQLQQLSAWQVAEVERLQKTIRDQNKLSYVEFEVELQQERQRLEQLARQYSVSVEEIEIWLRQQLVNLKTTGQVKVEQLSKWQVAEQQRLIELLLKQQEELSFTEFEQQLRQDQGRLQSLSQTHHVSIDQIEHWMRDELARLKSSGLVQVEHLTSWQNQMRQGFNDWLQQQHSGVAYKEFVEFLKRDKARISGIANEYHITVEEVEQWVQKEAARLSLLGVIERPKDQVTVEEIVKIWGGQSLQPNENLELWQQQTAGHLRAMALVQPMSYQQFEIYLVEQRPTFQQFARQYNITVEDIVAWLRQSASKMANEGLISGSVTEEVWQLEEQQHIQQLIDQQLRKQQKWTIEELELRLVNDYQRQRELLQKYKLTKEELLTWYKRELQRLLDQRKILAGSGLAWQLKELERIYLLVVQHPGATRTTLEEMLLRDRSQLQRLALEYHITEEQLTMFIRQQLLRFSQLGLMPDSASSGSTNKLWQEQERLRLREITRITITKQELLAFIEQDSEYQQKLASLYGISLEQLAPYQRIVIEQLQRDRLFQQLKLNVLQPWQQRERDRLYDFIRNQNFTIRELRAWQRQDMLLNEFARKYGISVHELKEWQLREFQRIMQLAEHYKMSLWDLQDFRIKELRYLTYIMHKKTSTAHEIRNWESNEAARSLALQRQTGLSGQQLLEWRRTLYLLCQGLIDLKLNEVNGGRIVDPGTTNTTYVYKPIISKDRGDQPPNVYEELLDEDEPGLADDKPKPLPLPVPIISTPAPLPYHPSPSVYPGPGTSGGYMYRKKEYQFTVPVGSASAAASGSPIGSTASASATVGSTGFEKRGTEHRQQTQPARQQVEEDFGQQQQVEDFGQQQQVELGWQDGQDAGQQQQLEEEVDWPSANYKAGAADLGQQQQQVEDLGQQQQVEDQVQVEDLYGQGPGYGASHSQPLQQAKQPTVEVQAEEEPKSLWSKISKKTSDFFG